MNKIELGKFAHEEADGRRKHELLDTCELYNES